MKDEKAKLIRLYVKAYLSLAGIVVAFVIVSIAQGAGWRPALSGMPLYVTLFAAITFKLIMDILRIAKKGREDQHSTAKNEEGS